jgi:hypothetical protein
VLAAEASQQHADKPERHEVEEGQGHWPIVSDPRPGCSARAATFLNPTGVEGPIKGGIKGPLEGPDRGGPAVPGMAPALILERFEDQPESAIALGALRNKARGDGDLVPTAT